MSKFRVPIIITSAIVLTCLAIISGIFGNFPKKLHNWGNFSLNMYQYNDYDANAPKFTQVCITITSQLEVQRWGTDARESEYSITNNERNINVTLKNIQEGGYSKFMDIDQGTSTKPVVVTVTLPNLKEGPIELTITRGTDVHPVKYKFELLDNKIVLTELSTAEFAINSIANNEELIPQKLLRVRWQWVENLSDIRDIDTEAKIGDLIFGESKWHTFPQGGTSANEPGLRDDQDDVYVNIYGYSDAPLKDTFSKIQENFPNEANKIQLFLYDVNGESSQYP